MNNEKRLVYSLEKIELVVFWWDQDYVIIPRSAIKKLDYSVNTNSNISIYPILQWMTLEMDLKYVKNEYAWYDEKKSKDTKIIDLFKGRNIGKVVIVPSENSSFRLSIPSYYKEFLLNYEGVNECNAVNLMENHEEKEEVYKLEIRADESKLKLNFNELKRAFKSTIATSSCTGELFQKEILFRLFDHIYYDDDKVREKELLFRLLKRFSKFYVRKTHSFFGRSRKGYKFKTIDEGNIVRFIGINHSYKTEVDFVFVSNMEDESIVQNLLPLKDDKHFTSGVVVIYDDYIELEKIKNVMGEDVIYISYSKANEYWCSIISSWYLGIGDSYKLWDFK